MAEKLRVVVRFSNGQTLKGTTEDFKPASPRFHLIPAAGGAPVEVQVDELKAVFFVRDLEGKPGRAKLQGFLEAPADTSQGRKIAVRFRDDELLCGYTLAWSAERKGFFLSPADGEGNNIRVYVVTGAAAEVKVGVAAEQLAQKVLAARH
jgi:hypothetical protein